MLDEQEVAAGFNTRRMSAEGRRMFGIEHMVQVVTTVSTALRRAGWLRPSPPGMRRVFRRARTLGCHADQFRRGIKTDDLGDPGPVKRQVKAGADPDLEDPAPGRRDDPLSVSRESRFFIANAIRCGTTRSL